MLFMKSVASSHSPAEKKINTLCLMSRACQLKPAQLIYIYIYNIDCMDATWSWLYVFLCNQILKESASAGLEDKVHTDVGFCTFLNAKNSISCSSIWFPLNRRCHVLFQQTLLSILIIQVEFFKRG